MDCHNSCPIAEVKGRAWTWKQVGMEDGVVHHAFCASTILAREALLFGGTVRNGSRMSDAIEVESRAGCEGQRKTDSLWSI